MSDFGIVDAATLDNSPSIPRWAARIGATVALIASWSPALAGDVHSATTGLGGIVALAQQCRHMVDSDNIDDDCSAALVVQPELAIKPTANGLFFAKLGFATSNLINNSSPLVSSPWAADLEDDVESINGTGRDYLLTAWYGHRFDWSGDHSTVVSAGLIDATDYLDENRYANDEFTQFMNSGLANGPNTFLPSYNPGAALDWHLGRWSLHGVYMDVDEDDGDETSFYAIQAGFEIDTSFGPGSYRLILARTGKDFPDPEGTQDERREDLIVSFDQQLGDIFGVFLRIELQEDNAAVVAETTWTVGLVASGNAWSRPEDAVGLGMGWLNGGNDKLRDGHGGET